MRWLVAMLFFPTLLSAQSGPSKRAWKNFQDNEFGKAIGLSVRAIEKDSTDALAWFVTSHLDFSPAFRPVDIDKADFCLRKTRRLYEASAPDVLADYQSEGLNEMSMNHLRERIDSAAFSRASLAMTENDFVSFLENFPNARQTDLAIAARDSLAFQSAVSVNTYHAYNEFMEKYPEARQADEARARYEKLYFDIATQDKRIESYVRFLKDNPSTPYRYEAEFNIFRIMTAANREQDYLRFLKEYPQSRHVSRARNYLYYLYQSDGREDQFPAQFISDSLRSLLQIQHTWVPVYENGKFGFMDETGKLVSAVDLESLFPDYRCEGIESDLIILPGKGVANRKLEIVTSRTGELTELPFGLISVQQGNKLTVLHKSGYLLYDGMYEMVRIKGRLLIIKEKGRWGLASLSGQWLLPPQFSEIEYENGFYFVHSRKGWQILTPEVIHALANNMVSELTSPVYDLYDFVSGNQLWLKKGNVEVLVNEQLEPVIPAAPQRIYILPEVYVARGESETRILSHDQMQRYTTGDKVLDQNDRWLILARENGVGLYSLDHFRMISQSDSARLIGKNYAITWFDGNRKLHTLANDPVLLSGQTLEKLLQTDSREWIMLSAPRSKTVINRTGLTIYEGPADNVVPLSDSLLVIERYGKKELLTLLGDKPLQVRFDGIGMPEDGLIPLLSGQRFGAYDMRTDLFIRPVSTKKIRRYNDTYYIAEMEKYGLINTESRMEVAFDFDEIRHWNDTTCLVRNGQDWYFYQIGQGLLEGEPMKSIQPVIDKKDYHEMIIFRNGAFGVLNSEHGEVIPPTLDDILNIGTTDTPVYFTDKFVSEANLHVVVYFDRLGNILRKQAMEEADFERIYCD